MAFAEDKVIDWLRGLLVAPGLIDLVLAFTVIEAVILGVLRLRTGRGLTAGAIGVMLLPGVFLLLAARAALTGTTWPWVPAALAAALVAHLVDLRQRWRR